MADALGGGHNTNITTTATITNYTFWAFCISIDVIFVSHI